MNTTRNQPSKESQLILGALKEAVANAMERKRKLGQYAVVLENDKLVFKGEDAPQTHTK